MTRRFAVVLLLTTVGGCRSAGAGAGPADAPRASTTDIALVDATTVVGDCPDSSKLDAGAAERTIHRLVEGCDGVPGGSAHFSATLTPNGRIELAAPDGNVAAGVVPTCVLKHQLTHRLPLKAACHLDVRVEQKALAKPGP